MSPVQPSRTEARARLLERLSGPQPLVSVELRPPRSDLSHADSIDTWIDMHHAVRRLLVQDTLVFLTDNAVGQSEEENLHHLVTNLGGEVDPRKLVPFLTCKHSLEYCYMYAARAASSGYAALTVLGGDQDVGAPRCVAHAWELREKLRARVPGLALGGWANPHRDPAQQVEWLEEERFHGDFFLTQVVSHHDLPAVERFLGELRRRRVELPGVFGVFYYRSASPRTLAQLAQFMPVPIAGLQAEFARGDTPEQVCARTIRALREVGVDKVYVSNLGTREAERRLKQVLALL
jgi:hypothetical protein